MGEVTTGSVGLVLFWMLYLIGSFGLASSKGSILIVQKIQSNPPCLGEIPPGK